MASPLLSIPDVDEDDGSVFTEVNGVKRKIPPGENIQACGTFETVAAKSSKFRNLTTVVPTWLESKHPLNAADVKNALWIVSRQVPHLQLCLSKRRCKLWFKRVNKLDIDFETTTRDVMEVIQEMFETTFDLWNGPLWKVRLIHNQEKTESNKFSSIFVFVTLHTINDGVTNMKIVRDFVTILNQISSGKDVTPTFSPVVPPIDKVLKLEVSLISLYMRACKTFYNTIIKSFHHVTSFSGSLPIPNTTEAKTKVLISDFSKNESETLAAMCKRENITINTFIITIANFALLTVAQSKSNSSLGTRKIFIAQSVNVRRHFEPQYIDIPGYHVSLLENNFEMSLSEIGCFWDVAKKNQQTIKENLEIKKEHLNILAIYGFTHLTYAINHFLSRKGYRNKTLVHYLTSNMGNLKNYLPEPNEDDNVQITYLLRTCSLHFSGSLFLLNFHTLNGRLLISMDYYTNQLEEEVATKIFTTIFKFIKNVINRQNIMEGNE